MEFTDVNVKIIQVLVKSLLPKVFDNNLYLSSQVYSYQNIISVMAFYFGCISFDVGLGLMSSG